MTKRIDQGQYLPFLSQQIPQEMNMSKGRGYFLLLPSR